MKKLFISLIFLSMSFAIFGQHYPLNFEDYSESSPVKSNGTSYFGRYFTPKGQLKILVIYVGYEYQGMSPNLNSLGGVNAWTNNGLPNYIENSSDPYRFFYNNYSNFTTYENNANIQNVSKFYDEMSMHNFQVIFETYKDAN